MLINIIRDVQLNAGVAKAQAYSVTLYIMACFLVIEFFFAILIRPVNSKYYMTEEEVKAAKAELEEKVLAAQASGVVPPAKPTSAGTLIICWLIVGIPLVWGVYQVALQTAKMFA